MRPELSQAIGLLRGNSQEDVEKAIGLLQNTVYSFSMKVCGHREDAEDNMQEVLYRSLKHLVRIEDPSALAVWLYTVTRNRCWRMRRKQAGVERHVSLDELMPDEAELGRLLADSNPSPEKSAMSAQEQRLLEKTVLRLPPQLRIVLVLHDMEELDTEEVAQILALKPGTVRVRLHRARLLLRKEYVTLTASAKKNRAAIRKPARNVHATSARRPMGCRDLFGNLSEYLDGRIETLKCEQMDAHIEACPACVAFIRDLRAAIDRCRSLNVPCSAATTRRLRTLLTREYLRLLASIEAK